jgi:hypothetical protein
MKLKLNKEQAHVRVRYRARSHLHNMIVNDLMFGIFTDH